MSDVMVNVINKTPHIARDAITALRHVPFEVSDVKITAERLPAREALALYASQLHELSKRALMPNLVHDAAILAPALEYLDKKAQSPNVILAWQHLGQEAQTDPKNKRLVGWLVVQRNCAIPAIGPAYLKNWHHLQSYMGHPVVDRDTADKALSALFENALTQPGASGRLMMSNVPGAGPMYDAILRVTSDNDLLIREIGRHQRAAMVCAFDGDAYLKLALSGKKRKEYRRLKNRLSDRGCLKFETFREEDDISSWIDDFLELEGAGWKGRKQTAFNNRQDWAAFLQASSASLVENGHFKIWRLSLDNKVIAITFAHHVKHRAWLNKITYDENYARYSPGVLLMLEVTKALGNDPMITEVDSLATPDHPMINRLWRQKISATDIIISTNSPPAETWFAITCGLIKIRRELRAKAKSLYYQHLKGARK